MDVTTDDHGQTVTLRLAREEPTHG
jgi:hypothetical protein